VGDLDYLLSNIVPVVFRVPAAAFKISCLSSLVLTKNEAMPASALINDGPMISWSCSTARIILDESETQRGLLGSDLHISPLKLWSWRKD